MEETYLFTNVIEDSNFISFQGKFADANCPTCPVSLAFEIGQAQGSSDVNLALSQQNYPYRQTGIVTPVSNGFDVTFAPNPQGFTPAQYVWDFGDGTQQTVTQGGAFTHLYNNPGNYQVCVQMVDGTNCQSDICRTISTDEASNCAADFSVVSAGFNLYLFSALPSGTPPFTYTWEVPGDSLIPPTTLTQPILITNFPAMNVDGVKLTVTDGTGCTSHITKSVNDTGSGISTCSAHFSYSASPHLDTIPVNTSIFSTIVIRFTDESGTLFSSEQGLQDSTAYFEILGVEDYDRNENNLPTKKLTVRFACKIYDEQGNFKTITDGNGTIAVGYF